MSMLKAVVYDTVRDTEVTFSDRCSLSANDATYLWFEGNYACDCNRGIAVDSVLEGGWPSYPFKYEYPCGNERFELRGLYLDDTFLGADNRILTIA